MHLRPLLRNAARIGLLAVGGVMGAIAVVWVRANSDWATVRLPAVMAPGTAEDVEYEARVYAIVAIAFAAGVLASFWVAVAVWLRAVARERRLSQLAQRVEREVKATRELHEDVLRQREALAVPALARGGRPSPFDEFESLDEDRLLAEASELPPGYGGAEPPADDEGEDDRG